jgi:hypothetical protein
MKQFAYLLSELASDETVLMTMDKNGEPDRFPDQHHIVELLARHFPNLIMEKEGFDPREYLRLWLEQKKNALFVTGSFGRSALSRLFKKSFIEDLFEDMKLPLFIAHR